MFDVSFSELALILVVGLIVFGPEKLPEVIRTAGVWIGKIKRTYTQMRTEIEREMGVDELKRDIHNSTIMQNLRDVQNDLQSTQHDLQRTQHDFERAQQELQHLPYDVNDVVQRANTPPSSAPISEQATHATDARPIVNNSSTQK